MNYRDFKPYSKISSLTLGGGGIGQVWGETTSEEAIKTVHAAIDHGINHFDVAPMYGKGEAERIIGKSLNGSDADDLFKDFPMISSASPFPYIGATSK